MGQTWMVSLSTLVVYPCTLYCRYTGYVQGLQETYKKTPVMAQLETKKPGDESFIHTRTSSPPRTTIATMQRDPCNFEENFKKPDMEILWPRLQDKAAQVAAPCQIITLLHALGDQVASYRLLMQCTCPFPSTACFYPLLSPISIPVHCCACNSSSARKQ